MWWFRRRRRREPPPLVLPALDRLAELVERVVALLADEELVSTRHKRVSALQPGENGLPEPESTVHSVRTELVSTRHKVVSAGAEADGWVAFVSSSAGYRIAERVGEAPARGAVVELDGGSYRVRRLGPSPLPGDRRRCAYVEREEPPGEGGNGHG